MALTDRIASLVDAIAAAFNARVTAPASGYDVAVLNGYLGTQAQWLASLVPQPTPQLPVPAAVERFDALANGAAWPARWTRRGGASGVATVQSQAGLLSQATGGQGFREQLEAMAAMGEHGITFTFQVSTSGVMATFINGAGTGSAAFGGAMADTCYALSVSSTTGANQIILSAYTAGAGTAIASQASTVLANTLYRARLERIGAALRAKIWLASTAEPEAYTIAGAIPAAALTGFAGVGMYGNNTDQTVTYDDVLVYGLEEVQATTAIPGILALATPAETLAGLVATKAVTPASLALRAPRFVTPTGNYGAARWMRVGTVVSPGSSIGAQVDALLSGMGDYSGSRANWLLTFSTFGDTMNAARMTNLSPVTAQAPPLSWKKTATNTWELWVQLASYQQEWAFEVLDGIGAGFTPAFDSLTATNPGSLTAFEAYGAAQVGYGAIGYTNGTQQRDSGGANQNFVYADWNHTQVDFSLLCTVAVNRDGALFTIPAGLGPHTDAFLSAAYSTANGPWTDCHVFLSGAGTAYLLNGTIAAGQSIVGSGRFKHKAGQ